MAVVARVLHAIADAPQAGWDALLGPAPNPFLRWSFLHALEAEGCVAPDTGWTPRHLTLWEGERLLAAAPAYVKDDSDGDFSRDWDWAGRLERAGAAWYPKLVVSVPFTPASGPRLLVAEGTDRSAASSRLLALAREVAVDEGCGVVQALYPADADLPLLEQAGFAPRAVVQYHWRNAGYASFDDFLGRFNSKRRIAIRRERAAPASHGIDIRTVTGPELARDAERWGRDFHRMHAATVDRMAWGRRWLNERFYARIFSEMPDALEVVEARREGRLVAGAFNLSSSTHLYGRYWGAVEDHPFLHFNVCLYHSIDECIRRRISVFEGGAGGEHKLARGFEPVAVWTAVAFTDERVAATLRGVFAEETAQRLAALERWRREEAVLKPRPSAREAVR
ncbi:MAG: GNAT family N-acetyltransferase [Myxococcales bacterium]